VIDQIIRRLVVRLEHRRQDARHIEDVPLISERIALVAPAVGGIAEQVGSRIDIVLLRRIVDGVRPRVRAVQLVAMGELLAQRDVQPVVA